MTYQNHDKKSKDKIIWTIIKRLLSHGLFYEQLEENVDADIIRTSIEFARDTKKLVVGQDIDLVVLRNQFNSNYHYICFLKAGSGNLKDHFLTSNCFKYELNSMIKLSNLVNIFL